MYVSRPVESEGQGRSDSQQVSGGRDLNCGAQKREFEGGCCNGMD